MVDVSHELAVLDVALPYLGDFADVPEKIQEQNDPEHPGHTFDFAGARPDGRRVAIEVTDATYAKLQRDVDTHPEIVRHGNEELQRVGAPAGTYFLTTSLLSPKLKPHWPRIASAACTLAEHERAEIARDVALTRQPRPDGRAVFGWLPSTGGLAIHDAYEALLSAAINANTEKLTRAADEGYETALLIVPEWLPHGPNTIAGVCETIRSNGLGPIPETILLVARWEEGKPVTRLR